MLLIDHSEPWKLRSGDYVAQVIVTDRSAKEKQPVVTQAVDFEVGQVSCIGLK